MLLRVVVFRLALPVVLLTSAQSLESAQTVSAEHLNQVGIDQFKNMHYDDALTTFNEVWRLYEMSGDMKGEATALSAIAMCYSGLGKTQRALDYFERALPNWRQIGDRDDEASTLGKEGDLYRLWGFPDQALRYYKQSLPLFLIAGDRAGRAAVLNNPGACPYRIRQQEACPGLFH